MMTQCAAAVGRAEADNKPELEIFADDVQCGHGATAGALDEDLLFYLMARGIPAKEAEALLIQAFVGEAIEGIEHAGLRDALMDARRRLAEDAGSEPCIRRSATAAYDVDRIRADFPILAMQVYGKPLVYLDNAASAQKPQGGARPHPAGLHLRIRQRASRPALSRQCGDRGLRGRAREGARVPQRRRGTEEIIFTRNATEAINLVAYTFGRERIKAGDEIVLSIMEHHSNIVPWHFLRERQGAVIKWAPVDDDGNFLHRRIREAADAAHQDGRDHPHVERARHHRAGEGGGAARACPRHSGAGRRQPGRGASRRRRAGHRLRFLCLHRPQALRADRHRRALRQIRASRRHAAVQRRRRDDPRGVRGPRHLWRAAAQVRGRHAADRAGDRARRGASTMSTRSARRASARTRTELVDYAHERLREINSLRIIGTRQGQGRRSSRSR